METPSKICLNDNDLSKIDPVSGKTIEDYTHLVEHMDMEELFCLHPPYETYKVKGIDVDVKREDLYCHETIAPLAKMRGVNTVMTRLKEEGQEVVGVYDFKVSRAGVGISAMAKFLGMKCYACYPHYKSYNDDGLPAQQLKCVAWGAELHPVRAAQIQINFNMGLKFIREMGGYMFPKGIILEETLESVASEIDHDAERLRQYDNIVFCNGSGTIGSGMLRGLVRNGLYPNIFTVSCTNTTKHCKRLHQYLQEIKSPFIKEDVDFNRINIELIPSSIEYYTECEIESPFPSHPNYDKKAWLWLNENIDRLEGKTLFWNIGA